MVNITNTKAGSDRFDVGECDLRQLLVLDTLLFRASMKVVVSTTLTMCDGRCGGSEGIGDVVKNVLSN